ncbi:MAG: hypothetical protein U0930_05675 [Pirellulales bacterium]
MSKFGLFKTITALLQDMQDTLGLDVRVVPSGESCLRRMGLLLGRSH